MGTKREVTNANEVHPVRMLEYMRRSVGHTVEEFARRADIDPCRIVELEAGARPGRHEAARVAAVFGWMPSMLWSNAELSDG